MEFNGWFGFWIFLAVIFLIDSAPNKELQKLKIEEARLNIELLTINREKECKANPPEPE